MKKFCVYAVIEVETADLLACGQKWKDFFNTPMGNYPVRYVNCAVSRPFYRFFRKVTTYFRDIDIMERHYVIVYWVYENARVTKRTLWRNIVSLRGFELGLRGWRYCFDNKDTREIYRRLLDCLGVTSENV